MPTIYRHFYSACHSELGSESLELETLKLVQGNSEDKGDYEKNGLVSELPSETSPHNTPLFLKVLSDHVAQTGDRLKETFERHLPCNPDRIFCHSKLVILFGIIHKEEDYPHIIRISQ